MNTGEPLKLFNVFDGFVSHDVYYEVWEKDGDDFSCFATFRFKQVALDYVSVLRSHGIDSFACEVNRRIIDQEDIK